MSKKASRLLMFVRGSIILTVSNLLIKATNFFLLPLYTSYLSPDQLGVSDSIVSLMSIVTPLLVVAFDSAFGAFYYEEDNDLYKKKIFNTTFFFLFGMSFFTIIPILFSNQISYLMFGSQEYAAAIKISMLSVVFNMWLLPASLTIRMQNRMTVFSLISFSSSLIMILMNIYFVTVLKLGYFSLILSNMLINAIQLVLFGSAARIPLRTSLFDKPLFKKMIKYALPMLPMVLSSWTLSVSDRYILLFCSGEYEVGIYGVAARFLNVLTVITSAIYTAFSSFAFSVNKENNAKDQYIYVLDAVHIVLLSITVFVSAFINEILYIMVDKSYYEAGIIIAPLLLGQVCYAANTIMGYGFAYKKKSVYFLIPAASGAILNIILNLIFIPKYGAFAASLTTFVGYFVMMLMTYILSKRVYDCKYHIVKLIISVLLCFILCMICNFVKLWLAIILFIAMVALIIIMYRNVIKSTLHKVKKGFSKC